MDLTKIQKIFCQDITVGYAKDFFAMAINPNDNNPIAFALTPQHAKRLQQYLDNKIAEYEAGKIVYVSCNPATQARDIALISDKYKVSKMQPVDMFPHTSHVENVALLERI